MEMATLKINIRINPKCINRPKILSTQPPPVLLSRKKKRIPALIPRASKYIIGIVRNINKAIAAAAGDTP